MNKIKRLLSETSWGLDVKGGFSCFIYCSECFFSSTLPIQAHVLSMTGLELSRCTTVSWEALFTFEIHNTNDLFIEICGLHPAEWILWFLSRPTQVAVLCLSVSLSTDILDKAMVDVYVIMVRFKEKGFIWESCFRFFLWRGLFEVRSANLKGRLIGLENERVKYFWSVLHCHVIFCGPTRMEFCGISSWRKNRQFSDSSFFRVNIESP